MFNYIINNLKISKLTNLNFFCFKYIGSRIVWILIKLVSCSIYLKKPYNVLIIFLTYIFSCGICVFSKETIHLFKKKQYFISFKKTTEFKLHI